MNLILTVIGYSNYLSHTRGVVVCAFQGIDSFHLSYQIYVCRLFWQHSLITFLMSSGSAAIFCLNLFFFFWDPEFCFIWHLWRQLADTIKLWIAAKFYEVWTYLVVNKTPMADILEYSSIFQADERCDITANNFFLAIHWSHFLA